MWGWKPVERLVEPSISFDDAKRMLQEDGFRLRASQPGLALFERAGVENPQTTLAAEGRNVALELALAPSHAGLFLQLRYATFVLFDTGDLSEFADDIADLLVPCKPSGTTSDGARLSCGPVS
jgi:hypothetical protein